MNRVLAIAQQLGILIQYVDLGDWGSAELHSEYDPDGPTIRVNTRVLAKLPPCEISNFIGFAVAHELYHHREHRRQVEMISNRAARESAANNFARDMMSAMP